MAGEDLKLDRYSSATRDPECSYCGQHWVKCQCPMEEIDRLTAERDEAVEMVRRLVRLNQGHSSEFHTEGFPCRLCAALADAREMLDAEDN